MENLILWNMWEKKLIFYGHIERMEEGRLPKSAFELDSDGTKEKRKTKEKLACWSNEGYGKSWTGVWPVALQI